MKTNEEKILEVDLALRGVTGDCRRCPECGDVWIDVDENNLFHCKNGSKMYLNHAGETHIWNYTGEPPCRTLKRRVWIDTWESTGKFYKKGEIPGEV